MREQTTFERFDICEAAYLFAEYCHAGQRSPVYRIFGRLAAMRFNPRPSLSWDSLTDNSQAIYRNLWRHYYPGEPVPAHALVSSWIAD